MMKIDDDWVKSDDILKQHARTIFVSLLSMPAQSPITQTHVLNVSEFQLVISQEDYARLIQQLDFKELKQVVWSTHLFMAPGLDGLQSIFYQKYWNWIHTSLLEFIQGAFENKTFDPSLCGALLC